MFMPAVVWTGFVYTALMVFGKALCGICLVRFQIPVRTLPRVKSLSAMKLLSKSFKKKPTTKGDTAVAISPAASPPEDVVAALTGPKKIPNACHPLPKTSNPRKGLPKPQSLYPSAILGMAMVARGEIGFLVSSTAESTSTYTSKAHDDDDQQLFMVMIWAILLCTMLGPVSVG